MTPAKQIPFIRSRHLALLGAALCLLAGCFGSTYTPIDHYVVEPEFDIERVTASDRVVAVYPFNYARRYGKKMVSYNSQYELTFHDFDQWAELPRDFITGAIIDGLIASNAFADVSYASDVSNPDLILTGELRQFDERRTEDGPWIALCEVRIELRSRRADDAPWTKTFRAASPLETNDARGFSAAMSEALGTLVENVVAELTAYDRQGD